MVRITISGGEPLAYVAGVVELVVELFTWVGESPLRLENVVHLVYAVLSGFDLW